MRDSNNGEGKANNRCDENAYHDSLNGGLTRSRNGVAVPDIYINERLLRLSQARFWTVDKQRKDRGLAFEQARSNQKRRTVDLVCRHGKISWLCGDLKAFDYRRADVEPNRLVTVECFGRYIASLSAEPEIHEPWTCEDLVTAADLNVGRHVRDAVQQRRHYRHRISKPSLRVGDSECQPYADDNAEYSDDGSGDGPERKGRVPVSRCKLHGTDQTPKRQRVEGFASDDALQQRKRHCPAACSSSHRCRNRTSRASSMALCSVMPDSARDPWSLASGCLCQVFTRLSRGVPG